MQIKLLRSQDGELTIDKVKEWLYHFKECILPLITENQNFYLNSNCLELPYAKKIVTIASAATIGDGVTIKAQKLESNQQAVFDTIINLFKKQTIGAQDLDIFTMGSTYGYACELGYMSSDEVPVPKVAALSPYSFVVFDDTAENNSLFGFYFNEQGDEKNKSLEVHVFDDVNEYKITFKGIWLNDCAQPEFKKPWGIECFNLGWEKAATHSIPLNNQNNILSTNARYEIELIGEHNMGRMPMTMYFNNRELQGDFEQVKAAILSRNELHNLALSDARTIASNIMVFEGGAELGGESVRDKKKTMVQVAETKAMEVPEGTVKYLTKNESFALIDTFGKDVDKKIYDLAIIPNFTSEDFMSNVSGVALRLKLYPFKRLIKNKDNYIEKLYKRRIKMYQHALTGDNYEPFDVADIEIVINRTWEENIAELAQTILTLQNTGLWSKQSLIELMPQSEYESEKARILQERDEEGVSPFQRLDPMNSQISQIRDMIAQGMGIGNEQPTNEQ